MTSMSGVPAGSSHDLDLSTVPAGAYTVQVVSDEPVVAGAMVRTAQTPAGGDLAWSASSAPVASLTGIAFVSQSTARHTDLLLSAPDKAGSIDVVSVAADGSTTTSTVDLTGGTTRVVPLTGVGARLRPRAGSGPVVAARELRVQLPQRTADQLEPVASDAVRPGSRRTSPKPRTER